MKAILCKELGGPDTLVYEEIESQSLGRSGVRIEVKAAGVNFLDTLIIQGLYQVKPPLPFSPGCEVAGIVTEIGEAVKNVVVGDRVIANVPWGGYASEVTTSALSVMKMTDSMSFEEGAALPIIYGTAIHALKQRANLQPGEKLAVLGASGGVGTATVQLGKLMGAEVIAAAGSDDKLAKLTEMGADHLLNYSDASVVKDQLKKLSGGKGCNVIMDAVGGDVFDGAVRALAWEGRMLVVGFAAGRIPTPAVNLLLLKSSSLMGVFWGQFAQKDPIANAENFAQLMQWYEEGKFKPHIHATYALEDAAQALSDISERKVVGKAILVP